MIKGIFITATGTDVGKTYITTQITKKLRENNINAGYYKAALSGARVENNKVIECDCLDVLDASSIKGECEEFVSYIFETPVSPHLASRLENKSIKLNKIKDDFNRLKEKYEYITVEGSGGIVCPISLEDETIMLTDIVKLLDLDIIVVAPSDLGTINSTVLTVEYARNQGINVKGIIMNYYDSDNFVHVDNKKALEFITGVSVIGLVEKDGNLSMTLEDICSNYKELN
ncbi:dethiobiotin synthase [Clostridium cylindrosporum]|uniref:ATP-dependent dethiobiotin synthetase BioD n=1 Tax=Clostridium cylindrosporum DSM 605 TaxID=1121307 RepID=A0A0J8D9I1_CLOCY|nr:dethiobiotin synthase [Clostridium cylindrosporum]KMT20979.1 ATP-dependent dethiobiotin synthetase BioD [Clostridium cylindrosporum DSM 605]